MASANHVFRDDALIKKVEKFFRKEWTKEMSKIEAPTRKVTCFECGEKGHVKSECPTLEKKNNYFKRKKDKRPKKAYIAWDDNEISSSSDKEHANLALIATHHSDDEEEEVSNETSSYDNDALNAIDELLNECKILYKKVSTQKKHILSLEEKIDTMEKDFQIERQSFLEKEKQNLTCKECESLSSKLFN